LVVRHQGPKNGKTAYLPFFRILRQQSLTLFLITNTQIILAIDPIAIQSLKALPFLFGVFVDFVE
jgi:hypothetical protein